MSKKTIGIIGAGKLGTVLAQLATQAGHRVVIAGSGSVDKIRLTVSVLAPQAVAATTAEVVAQSDIIILALPLRNVRQLTPSEFAGKVVIDATNFWWEVDGPRAEILPDEQSTSEWVQSWLAESRVVKALSHVSYHDLHDGSKAAGSAGRRAIAIAGNDERSVASVVQLVDELGFDPLPIGRLSAGVQLEPGHSAFGANLTITELQTLLNLNGEVKSEQIVGD